MTVAWRIFEIRNRYDPASTAEKRELLTRLDELRSNSAKELALLHSALCFISAFPDTAKHHRLAGRALQSFERRVSSLSRAEKARLADSGIVGTRVGYGFSYEVATWLHRLSPGSVSIDWSGGPNPEGLDDILTLLLHESEDEYFDSGYVSSREWIEMAAANTEDTDFQWLLRQMQQRHDYEVWAQLYNSADLWLTWDLHRSRLSKSLNAVPTKRPVARASGMRRPGAGVKREILKPIDSMSLVSARTGARLIDVAIASLATRHRETYHFSYANPREVYVADAGEGVSVAVYGLKREYRFPLECTMGYLILSNGMPIGYGGSSVVFKQVNTGLNVFDEFRHSEAAYLWVQVMRVYHQLTGCTRFIANPYQFGEGNDEALKSGAFWLYYRLGYRPVDAAVRKLARREFAKIRKNRRYRSSLPTLRQLASCDMHLTLPGARQSELFDEEWLQTSSMLATKVLGEAGGGTRSESVDRVVSRLARDVGMRTFRGWTSAEKKALRRIAPIAAAAQPAGWSVTEKRAMRTLLRAKGGECEARYARLLGQHQRFLSALRRECRRQSN